MTIFLRLLRNFGRCEQDQISTNALEELEESMGILNKGSISVIRPTGKSPPIFTSQVPVNNWHDIMG